MQKSTLACYQWQPHKSRVPVPVPPLPNMPISQILYLFYANAGQHLTFTLYTHTDRNRRQARQMHRSNVWQHVLVPIRLTCAQHTHDAHISLYIELDVRMIYLSARRGARGNGNTYAN